MKIMRDDRGIRKKNKLKQRQRSMFLHGGLILVCLIMMYPLIWMARGSIAPENEIFSTGMDVPSSLEFSNYVDGWNANPPGFGQFMINSILVSTGVVIGNLVACTLAAYAFARIEF